MHSNPAASGTDNSFRFRCGAMTSSGFGVFFLKQDTVGDNFIPQALLPPKRQSTVVVIVTLAVCRQVVK
jgi:hypothetical protein